MLTISSHKGNANQNHTKIPPHHSTSLSYYAYVFSSTKSEIRAEQALPGSEGGREEAGRGDRGEK
jgi:hypothetical protein